LYAPQIVRQPVFLLHRPATLAKRPVSSLRTGRLKPLAKQSWPLANTYLRWQGAAQQAWLAGSSDGARIAALQRRRLHELIEFARQHSRFYREAYARLPQYDVPIQDLPVVTKAELMARFDDWVTDPEITRAGVEKFTADPGRVGTPFLGKYSVWTSSGTSGIPGIFVQDADALAVYDALSTTRFAGFGRIRGWDELWGMLTSGGRLAMIAATGGHFAGIATWQRLRATYPWLHDRTQIFPVTAPIAELCAALNRYQPAFIASYPTTLQVLAAEQQAGRLAINPQALWSGGEWLAPAARAAVRAAFGCPLTDDYGASEFMNIAFQCPHGALHVNSDWALLEPVDEKHRPVPEGVASATVLLTNLANRVQPLIRYDLGDSVTLSSAPCACGSPFPVICVEGRRDEILSLKNSRGRSVPLLPLALCTVVEEGAGLHRFQIIQTAPSALSVKIECPTRKTQGLERKRVGAVLKAYLATQGLSNVKTTCEVAELASSPVSGKLRQVWKKSQPADKPKH
jgi:phenylacetate-CoA ligase